MESPPEETRNLRMSSYKMESPAPSLQNGLPETHRYFPGASNWNTSGAKLEHNWNTSGTPTAEVNTTGTQLEHLPQKCKCNTTGTQVEHNWYTHTGVCRASGLYRMQSTRSSVCNQIFLTKWRLKWCVIIEWILKWCVIIEWTSHTSTSSQHAPLQNA